MSLTKGAIAAVALALAGASFAAGPASAQQLNQSVANSPHNLSGLTTATDEVCVFCHTPHGALAGVEAPLWNKPEATPGNGFTLYDSSTLDGEVIQTVGSVSAACLTCHDGTQAMDTVINAPGTGNFSPAGIEIDAGGIGTIGTVSTIADLGIDLSNDHPIGIEYGGGIDGSGNTTDPDFVVPVSALINGQTRWWVDTSGGTANVREKTDMILYNRADGNAGQAYVECGSCHDPHVGSSDDAAATADDGVPDNSPNNTQGSGVSFLRIANAGSDVCLACHVK